MVHGLTAALETFFYHFLDVDDGLEFPPLLPELDAAHCTIESIHLSLWGISSVSIIDLSQGVLFQYDSFNQVRWNTRTFINIPIIAIQSLATTDDLVNHKPKFSKSINSLKSLVEVFRFETSFHVCVYDKPLGCDKLRDAQMAFLKLEDEQTKRCATFYSDEQLKERPHIPDTKKRWLFNPIPLSRDGGTNSHRSKSQRNYPDTLKSKYECYYYFYY